MLTFIDIFAGIGGFRMGMEQAGHKCVGFIEIDKSAVRSYRAIFDVKLMESEAKHSNGCEFYADDIRNVMPEQLPEADCYCGGFPCQSFSVAGKRGGFSDTRGTLIFEVFRLIAVRKPKLLFLENVAGLLNHDNGRTFGTILNSMAELGYDVQWQCVNSKAFVPQSRERIFIVGHHGGKGFKQIFPIVPEYGEAIKQIIGGCQGSRIYDPTGVSVTISSGSGGLGAKTGLYLVDLCKDNPKITDNARCLTARYNRGVSNRDGESSGILTIQPIISPTKDEVYQNGRRIKEDNEDMFCLTATDRHGIVIYDGKRYRIRRLTPKECFRLQGFPDWAYEKAKAVNSDNALYKQAGNSVTVPVIHEIAKRLTEREVLATQ